MGKALVKPGSVRLELPGGEWVEVKRRLNAGEARRVFSRMVKSMAIGEKAELDPMEVGRSQAVEYLLDWSFEDLPIADKSPQDKSAALDAMDLETFNDVVKACGDHEKAMDAERAKEKNGTAGEKELSAISSSAA